jgi:DNA-binding transcriptional LysR family regulator
MVYRFDAHRLLVLREVARAGSIAAAARTLGYSEATLAHHLRILQDQAGLPLTRRVGRTTHLTTAGQALARRGDAIAEQLTGADNDIADHSDLTAGTLRITAFPSYCARALPEGLARFSTSYPGVVLELAEAEPGEALEQLARNLVDLAVIFADPANPPDLTGFASHPLGDDAIKAVLPRHHPGASHRRIDIGRLADDAWIAGCPRCQDHLHRLTTEAGFTPRISFATDDYLAVQRFVANGLGVALLPQIALDNSPQPGRVAIVDLDPPEHRNLLAVTSHRPSLPTRAMLRELESGLPIIEIAR